MTFRALQKHNDAGKLMVLFFSRLQRLLESQNRRIDQLMEKIKQQQDKLEKQSLHLQALQSKVSYTPIMSRAKPQLQDGPRHQTTALANIHLKG